LRAGGKAGQGQGGGQCDVGDLFHGDSVGEIEDLMPLCRSP
jgi:hypothetical protein